MTGARIDFRKYCVISIWFGCNNKCGICMLSKSRSILPAISYEGFKKTVLDIMLKGRFENLILSGAEVTTFDELEKYVKFAASLGWFNKIQVQTNGRRLRDRSYLDRLIEAGVNEFFVSIHGFEATHDAAAGIPGAFGETMQGLRNLAGSGDVNVISNTVLTRDNLPEVPDFLRFLGGEGVSEMHLWNYFPVDNGCPGDLVVSLGEICGLLPALGDAARESGKPLVMKSFPLCLPAVAPVYLDSVFPETVLPDLFWQEFGKCGFGQCVHRGEGRCASVECWGLSAPYMRLYGDERNLLKPLDG